MTRPATGKFCISPKIDFRTIYDIYYKAHDEIEQKTNNNCVIQNRTIEVKVSWDLYANELQPGSSMSNDHPHEFTYK